MVAMTTSWGVGAAIYFTELIGSAEYRDTFLGM